MHLCESVKEANGRINLVILGVYVDYIIPVSNSPALSKAEKAALCERFQMIDQGEIHYLLGMSKLDRERRTLLIITWRKSSENLEWKTANLFLLHLSQEENVSSYHQVMSPSMFRPTNRQFDV